MKSYIRQSFRIGKFTWYIRRYDNILEFITINVIVFIFYAVIAAVYYSGLFVAKIFIKVWELLGLLFGAIANVIRKKRMERKIKKEWE